MKINILNLAGQTEGRYNLGQMQMWFLFSLPLI